MASIRELQQQKKLLSYHTRVSSFEDTSNKCITELHFAHCLMFENVQTCNFIS